MAFDVTGLSRYVDQNSFELLSKAVLETSLAQNVTVRAGLQGNQVAIPILEDNFISGGYDLSNYAASASKICGWNPKGSTAITQVTMALAHPIMQRAYCVNTLRDTFMSQQLSRGAQNGIESLPFEEVAASYFTKNVTNYNEHFLINGDTVGTAQAGATPYADTAYKGFRGLVAAGSGSYKWNDTGAGASGAAIDQALLPWTSGASVADTSVNALDAAMLLFEAAPAEIMMASDLVLVVGVADFKALVGAMVKANLYHYTGDVNEVIIPATNIRVVASSGIGNQAAVGGLTGRNFKFLTTSSNLIMGTDLTSDFDEFKVWYSQDNDEVRSSMKWAIGAAIVDEDLVASLNDTPVATT